jgi:hypothetical protein
MDDIRSFVATVAARQEDGFAALTENAIRLRGIWVFGGERRERNRDRRGAHAAPGGALQPFGLWR